MKNTPTGLVLPFPKLEHHIAEFRREAILPTMYGLMAHLTVIFPFMPQDKVTTAVSQTLTSLFQQIEPIAYTLDGLARFPGVLYLKMVDERPFIHLIQAVEQAFPAYPSFGGEYDTIVPHVTVAKTDDNQALEHLEARFVKQFPNLLTVSGCCGEVWLIEKVGDNYQKQTTFQLGMGFK